MSMTWDASPSSFFSSSSGMRTYWSLANSNPRTSSLRSTVVLQTGQNVCWRMREPHLACKRLNDTVCDDVAVYSRTGIETSPKEIVPEPMECGGIVWAKGYHR